MFMATAFCGDEVLRSWRTFRGFVQNCSATALTSRGPKGRATPAPPRRLAIPWFFAPAIAVLVLLDALGCSTRVLEQAGSFQGIKTEQLRDWVREDPQRHQLIVFVHGFNSNKDAAWGQFPTLLKDDPDFDDFNLHRFGYPTKRCRQISNIQNQGDLLASFLKEILTGEQPRYRQVVLVGHSMGGLVILHALLKLERDHFEVLQDKELKVLTFGTPFLGVENTDALLLFCDNQQAKDLSVLNDMLGELGHEWTQRFNQKPSPSGRETPQVPLYAFRGTEDRFISKTSACGYPQIPCESVDGDHDSIVKPQGRTHLSYIKLKSIMKLKPMKDKAEIKTIPPSNSITEPRMLDNAATLIKTCDQSRAKLKRPLGIFVPQWLSTLDRLRSEGWTPDLETLFRIWGGGRCFSGSTCQDQFEEATFTLKCLESSGQVRLENLKSNGLYHGVNFENQRIVFENR